MKRLLGVLALLFFIIQASEASFSSAPHFTGLMISWESGDELFVRTREVRTGEWTRWYALEDDADLEEGPDERHTVPLRSEPEVGLVGPTSDESERTNKETLFSTNLSDAYELSGNDETSIQNIRVELILSEEKGAPRLVAGLSIVRRLPVISRAEWGANENLTYVDTYPLNLQGKNGQNGGSEEADQSEVKEQDPEIKQIVTHNASNREYVWPLQYSKDVKFIVIHHTASVVNLENPKTAIQNILYYHSVKRGWGDIGYNYLIDTDGRIYEGRKGGDGVIAGHARPMNKVGMGIAILGNYQENEVPSPVIRSLMSLIGEKAKENKIDVNGKTKYKDTLYNNVQGHFENTATLCPGLFVKEKLAAIRRLVSYEIEKEKLADPPEYSFRDTLKRNIIVMKQGESKPFSIRLKNTGEHDWKKNTFLETSTTPLPPDTPKVLAKLVLPVAPGEVGIFKGTLPETWIPGLRVIEASLVVNGSIRPKKEIPVPILISGMTATYEIVEKHDPPATMKSGQVAKATVKLKNTGNVVWKRTGKQRVELVATAPPGRAQASAARSTSGRKSLFVGGLTRMGRLKEKEVKPGEVGTFLFQLKAPESAGRYVEPFQPSILGVTEMADLGMNFVINVENDEKPLRVRLSVGKSKPEFTSATGMVLTSGGKTIHTFSPEERATVVKLTSGRYRVRGAGRKFDMSLPPRFKALEHGILKIANYENRPAWNTSLNDNTFRGVLEAHIVDGKLAVINELPIEEYLKGIGEVSNGDPKEKVKTIMILARSYAKYYRDIARKFPGKPYDLDDDPDHTQKYIGYGFELRSENIVSAVEETRGEIVTYLGKPILTPYFHQSDGRTRSGEEVWGWKDRPYLQSVPDTFCGATKLEGHGVGLSGCGATRLAEQGKTAEDIIKYYLSGVEVGVAK